MLNKQKRNWVNWKLELVNNGTLTKVPYQPSGVHASSTNKNTWSSYDEVKVAAHLFNGVGIMFNGSILGIDLDHVLSAGVIQDYASRKLVDEANTYTEISPSGDGLHLFFYLSEVFVPVRNSYKPNRIIKYECYSQGRYFTVTENLFENRGEVRTIDGVEAERLLTILGYPWNKIEQEPIHDMTLGGLPEEDIVRVMLRAKNGEKARRLWEGDLTLYQDDESALDQALCNILAFYSGKRADVMERLWLASPAGKREKTQTRKDYRDRTIAAAIAYTKEVYSPKEEEKEETGYITKKGKNGDVILLCTENIQTFLNSSELFKGRLRFDEFTQRIEFKKDEVWQDLKDSDILYIQSIVSKSHPAFGLVSKAMVEDAIHSNAYNHSYDSVKNYILALKWDGIPRLGTWLSRAYGVPETPYHTAVGSNWLKGLVQRAVEPGCKFDYVLVLEGPQGVKKSTSLATLAHPWHVETTQTPDNRDFFMLLLGHLIVEFSEGETISRADTKKLKAIITMQEDVLRLPYAHSVSTHPRRCVFAMTTNEEHYLKDDTGNRRWLPVTIGEAIDIEWIRNNREQLFAEAYQRAVVQREPTWEFPKEETEDAQAQRRMVDPQTEEIQEWYVSLTDDMRQQGITTKMAFDSVYNKNATVILREMKMNRADEMRIGSILKNGLFLVKKRTMSVGVYKYRYFPTDKTPPPITIEQQFENAVF